MTFFGVVVFILADSVEVFENVVEEVPRAVERGLDKIWHTNADNSVKNDKKAVTIRHVLAEIVSLIVHFVLHDFKHLHLVFAREVWGASLFHLLERLFLLHCTEEGHVVYHVGVNVMELFLRAFFWMFLEDLGDFLFNKSSSDR